VHWDIHPSVVIGLAGLGGLYVYWGGLRAPRRQVAGFTAALIVMFAALNGPLHDLSDHSLFSAHMVQHLGLTLAFTPLLLYGTPAWVLRPLLRPRWVMALSRVLTRPLVAGGVFSGVMALSHFPVFYEAALRHHNLHIVQHLIFIATSVLLWWPVLSPVPELPRASYPGQVIYLFAIGLPMSAVGAFATLAEHPLYPFYAAAPRVWGLSPLDDQRYGGLIMWVGGTLVLWIAATVVWFRWAWREEKGEAERAVPLEAYVLAPRAATPRPPTRPGDGV